MEKLIEGLKEYRTLEDIDNPYFMDVEYHVLCHNCPDYLVPVQLRDIDGRSRLLYDVTGMYSIEEEMNNNSFSKEEMRIFLDDFRKLIGILDRFMLDISQLLLGPDEVFREKNGHYWWVYSPMKQDNPMKGIEKLFEWILSSIDYSDFELVQFTYYAYWYIRNHPFSEETLRKCLDYQPEAIAAYRTDSYDEFFQKEKDDFSDMGLKADMEHGTDRSHYDTFENVKGSRSFAYEGKRGMNQYSYEGKRGSGRYAYEGKRGPDRCFSEGTRGSDRFTLEEKKRPEEEIAKKTFESVLPEALCGVACGIFLIALAVFLVTGIRNNVLMELKYVIAGLMIGMILSADGVWQFRKRRKNRKKKDNIGGKEMLTASYDYSWEEEGGTEVLGIRKDLLKPAFKSLDDGKIYVIKEFPFYIGSDPGINQMVINESSVSRRHAAVIRGRQTGNYDLQDLRSTNGTWVNQTMLSYEKPVRLEVGSVIRFAIKSYEFIMLDHLGPEIY